MDESLQHAPLKSDADIATVLRAQREQARQFMSKWRESATGLEVQLSQQLATTLKELDNTNGSDGAVEDEIRRRQGELAGLERRLAEREQDVATRESHVQEQTKAAQDTQGRLNERLDHLQTLLGELEQRRTAAEEAESNLAAAGSEQQAALDTLNRQRTELEERQKKIEAEAAQLAAREKAIEDRERATRESRQHLAREMKLRHKEQLAEINARRAELQQIASREDSEIEGRIAQFQEELSRLRQQSDAAKQQSDDLRAKLEAANNQVAQQEAANRDLLKRLEEIASTDNRHSVEAAELTAALAEARERAESQYAASEAALKASRQDQEQVQKELADSIEQLQQANQQIEALQGDAEALRAQVAAAGDESYQKRIRELEAERDALVERLEDSEEFAHAGASSEQLEDLQRRYEMAMTEIRELKVANARHEERAAKSGGAVASQAMDWEAQKKRMLAQLEADTDEDDPQRAEDRLTIEGAIQMTDQAVAEKEQEIEELRRLLSEQSQNLGGVAVGAAAIAEMLDGDELVKQEREKLETLQQEWREKLRKAEIDISVERAKIARERAQLEERLQTLEQRSISDEGEKADAEVPKRGKWLARLGLRDGN